MNTNARSELIEKRGYRKDIAGNALSLYLSNSPVAAQWLAGRIGNDKKTLLELCCSVGVTLEYMAPVFKKVTGVDIDARVLRACRKNLEKLETGKKIDLIQGDVCDVGLLKKLLADIVIYDIPYWYPHKYSRYSSEQRDTRNPDLNELIKNIRTYISSDIIIFAPPEMDYEFFKDSVGACECVEIYIGEKHDRNYILLGNLIERSGVTFAKLSDYGHRKSIN